MIHAESGEMQDLWSREEGNKASMYKQTVSGENRLCYLRAVSILQYISLSLERDEERKRDGTDKRRSAAVHTAVADRCHPVLESYLFFMLTHCLFFYLIGTFKSSWLKIYLTFLKLIYLKMIINKSNPYNRLSVLCEKW